MTTSALPTYQPSPDLLKDRIILVTGAGSGIGRALALGCAAHGATVVLLGRTTRKLETLYDEIEHAKYPQAAIYPMNLEGAVAKDYDDLAVVLEREFGRLDGLLHNAAMFTGLTPIANYNPETWYRILQVNLNAPFVLTQALLGLLKQAKEASIVFTAHQSAEQGKAYWGAYGVAKGGQQTLMQLLASELETNTTIRVNSIDPGMVKTNLRLQAYPAAERSDWVEPASLLSAYLYLLGPDSRPATGQTFSLNDVSA